MGNNYFKFKQFNVEQDGVSMKVNTDGVLLGAWYSPPCMPESSVLDVGSGTGVIALMSAQRLFEVCQNAFTCDAVEIDTPSCIKAQNNFRQSAWKKNLKVFNVDFKSFTEESPIKYDAIVSNPPYFVNSLKNPSETKCNARHSESLPYEELLSSSASLLKEGGVLSVILPSSEFKAFRSMATSYGFGLKRLCRVFSKSGDKDPIRVMSEFIFDDQKLRPQEEEHKENTEAPIEEDLCIMVSDSEYTPEYKALTKDFYLKF